MKTFIKFVSSALLILIASAVLINHPALASGISASGSCGTGATNILVKWTSASACGSSTVTDTGSGVGIFASPNGLFTVYNTAGTQSRMNITTTGELDLADTASTVISLQPANDLITVSYWNGNGVPVTIGRKSLYDVFKVNTHFDSPGASELINVQVPALTHTIQGNLALQRSMNIGQMTYSAAGAQTVTAGVSLNIAGPPIQGTNVTITTPRAVQVQAGLSDAPGWESNGTAVTLSGACGSDTPTGGATAGTYTSRTTGSCVTTVTLNGATGLTAKTGWACTISNQTTANLIRQTSSTATTVTFTGVTVTGDVIVFGPCSAY